MDNIKDKQLYFVELSNKLEDDFDFLFNDKNFELDNYLNKRLYSNKEFQIFKKNFPFNFDENRLLYIFEHSQQFAEIKNFNKIDYAAEVAGCGGFFGARVGNVGAFSLAGLVATPFAGGCRPCGGGDGADGCGAFCRAAGQYAFWRRAAAGVAGAVFGAAE